MKYISKSISIFLISILLAISAFDTAYAQSNVIYEYSDGATPVTSGATLETITRFTDDGWLNINVLRVDVTNPDVKIDTMINPQIRSTASVKSFAQTYGAVAAINGGFFGWTDTAGVTNPVGPIFKDSQILTAEGNYNNDKDTFATLSVSKLNEVLCSYWKMNMSLVAQNGCVIPVGRYNRQYYGNKDITILDRKWGGKSIGTDTPKYGCTDIVEMVVINGVITEIRQAQPAVDIPENGYVVITRKSDTGDKLILDNFQVGETVQFNIESNPDWNNLAATINGGAAVVKDGNVPDTFSQIPEATNPNAGGTRSSRNPRTAVGSSKDGKTLVMVTVDGRRAGGSIGATLPELGQIMSDLGAYNAINLDGGGSTTMIARTPGTSNLDLINTPSDNGMRRVNNAVGVFSTAEPTNELSGLFIDTEDDNIFVNTSRVFTVRGYDKYYNPVDVDPKDIKWSISGIKGYFKDNTFHPTTIGRGKVKAAVGKISEEIEVSSLSSPVQLILSQNTLKIPLNQSKSFSVKGKNINGYYANIYPQDIKWAVKNGIGTFNQGTFTASKEGAGYIDASIGKTHAYCAVSVETEKTSIIDKFEDDSSTFLSYPASVPGSYEASDEQKHSGKLSGKLTYDFSDVENSRAAYIVLKDNGISLEPNSEKVGMWVYSTHESPNWLGAWVIDSKGKQRQTYFTKDIDWTGWKYVEASLEDIDSPAKLTRLYLVQPNPVADSGSIYVDDLGVTSSAYPIIDVNKIPKDTVPADAANKSTYFKKSSSSFRFAVFGQSREPGNPLEKLLVSKLVQKINSTFDASAFVGNSSHEGTKTIKKQLIATNKGYKSFDLVNSRFIQLDTTKSGLRTTDPKQWHWLLDQLDTAMGNNIFLFMAKSPEDFSDGKEAELFKKILTDYKKKTGKNIWVFSEGEKNGSNMEQGIKYITTAGYNVPGLTPKTSSLVKYMVVTVKGSTVTYEFKLIV